MLLFLNTGCGSSSRYYRKEAASKDYHIVKKGDTLYSIARRYNIPPKSLIQYNRIQNPKNIEIGQKIYLPSWKKYSTAYKKKKPSYSKKKNPPLKFIWPAQGQLTSKFGFRFGIPHKGIDIGAPYGTKVFAAYDGEVALVESRPRGLGNVIILKHEKDFITVYGHNHKILVKENQKVKKGQVISLMGSSGWSTGPHLHFEIRCNGEAINPLDCLP
ncbi:MAG: M23 family metallopeptidase [bacterium]